MNLSHHTPWYSQQYCTSIYYTACCTAESKLLRGVYTEYHTPSYHYRTVCIQSTVHARFKIQYRTQSLLVRWLCVVVAGDLHLKLANNTYIISITYKMDFDAKRKQQAELLEEKRLRLEKLRREKEERNQAVESQQSKATIEEVANTSTVDNLVAELLQKPVTDSLEEKRLKIEKLRRERADKAQSVSVASIQSNRGDVDDLVQSLLPQIAPAPHDHESAGNVSATPKPDPLSEKRNALTITKAVVKIDIMPKALEMYEKSSQTDASDYDPDTDTSFTVDSPLRTNFIRPSRKSIGN